MHSFLLRSAVLSATVLAVSAAPTPSEAEAAVITKRAKRQAGTSTISNSNQLLGAVSSFSADFNSIAAGVSVGEAILTQIVPAPGPTSVAQLQSELQTINNANPDDIFMSGYEILLNGLAGGDYEQIANAYGPESSTTNVNTQNPATPIYPKASPQDANYTLTEAQLRAPIYIPPGFTYGKIPPVIFLPGTASVAGQSFGATYGKLFMENKIADPVYLNLPGENLADIQVAAEYTAYAINYISGISGGKNVRSLHFDPSTKTPLKSLY